MALSDVLHSDDKDTYLFSDRHNTLTGIPISQSVNQSANQPANQSINQLINQSKRWYSESYKPMNGLKDK